MPEPTLCPICGGVHSGPCQPKEDLGVILIESALVPDYYDEGEDALHCLYEVKAQ